MTLDDGQNADFSSSGWPDVQCKSRDAGRRRVAGLFVRKLRVARVWSVPALRGAKLRRPKLG